MTDKKTKYTTIKVPVRSSEYYSKISKMRKTKSGGKTFQDKELARAAQAKGAATKRAKKDASQKEDMR